MIMVAEGIPGLNRFLKSLNIKGAARIMLTRMIAAFLMHRGRRSCLQAAGSVRSDVRHRAQVGRFLSRKSLRSGNLLDTLRAKVRQMFAPAGLFVFLVDATLCSQQGLKTPNTFHTGNRERRPRKGRRYGQNQRARRSVHSFTMGLLITPQGQRIPFQKAYKPRVTNAASPGLFPVTPSVFCPAPSHGRKSVRC